MIKPKDELPYHQNHALLNQKKMPRKLLIRSKEFLRLSFIITVVCHYLLVIHHFILDELSYGKANDYQVFQSFFLPREAAILPIAKKTVDSPKKGLTK